MEDRGVEEDKDKEEDMHMEDMDKGHEAVDVVVVIRVGEAGDGGGEGAGQTHKIERLFCSHARARTRRVVSRGPTVKMVAECCILLDFLASYRAFG